MLEFDRIYNSDCIEGMKQIESGKVDLIVTDPPYCISYKTGWRADDHRFSKEKLNDDNEQLIIDYMSECYRILKDDSAAYIFCSAKTLDFFMQQARNAGFTIKNVLIWRKNNHTAGDLDAQYGQCYEPILYLSKGGGKPINEFGTSDILSVPIPTNKRRDKEGLINQTEKPVKLMEILIRNSTNVGDVILDPFMGSGTTARACVNLERKYIGFEIDQRQVDFANNELKNMSRQLSLF